MKTTILLLAKKFFVSLINIDKIGSKNELVDKVLNSSFVPLESKASLSIIRTSELFMEFSNKYLEPFEINSTQMEIIKLLYFSGGKKLTQEQITKVSFTSKANISTQLIKLENLGFILREVNSDNKREKLISLTSLGEEKLLDIIEKCDPKVFKNIICKDDAKELIRILAVYRNNLQVIMDKDRSGCVDFNIDKSCFCDYGFNNHCECESDCDLEYGVKK